MSDNGIQNGLEKLWLSNTIDSRLILTCVSIVNSFQTMIDESLKLSQSMDEFKVVADKFDEQGLVDLSNLMKFEEVSNNKPTIESEIIYLKYQLKHCKNYLERQNIERELNRLYKERR